MLCSAGYGIGPDPVERRRPELCGSARTSPPPARAGRCSTRRRRTSSAHAAPRGTAQPAGPSGRRRSRSAHRARSEGSRGTSAAPLRLRSRCQSIGPAIDGVATGCSWKRNEVTTPKLPPPPRIAQKRSGCSFCAGGDEAPIGQHDVGLEQVVDRQPALAGQVSEPAAERQPADTGGRDDAARWWRVRRRGWRDRRRPRCSRRRSWPCGAPDRRGRPSAGRGR